MSHRVITLEVKNHYSGESKTFQVSNIDDINSIADAMGPQILSVIHGVKDVRAAVDRVAKYLSNHHMSVDIQDPWDDEEILPSSETKDEKPEDPKSSLDWKSFLEQNDKDENVNIADQHIYDSASQRGPSYYKNLKMAKSEVLEKDRGRITFPADPKITNRPDQNVRRVSSKNDPKTTDKLFQMRLPPEGKDEAVGIGRRAKENPTFGASIANLTTTSKLNPMAVAHNTNDAVAEHEGAHNLFANIGKKYGQEHLKGFLDHLVQGIDEDSFNNASEYLMGIPYYRAQYSRGARGNLAMMNNYKQEIINHIRDSVSKHPAQYDSVKGRTIKIKDAEDTSQRAFHKKIHGDNFNEFDNKLKQSWKNIKDLAESYSLTKNEEDSYYIMMQTMDINPLINLNQDEDSE
jgi:hypothetical protein